MRRASTSRRADGDLSPHVRRSRSVEQPANRNLEAAAAHVAKLSLDGDDDEGNTNDNQNERSKSSSGGKDDADHHELRRAMSDPLDAQFDEDSDVDDDKDDDNTSNNNNTGPPLPTLPRFPTRGEQNCWSEPPVDIFKVRGPRYFTTSEKIQSAKYLLQARGCDLFLNNEADKSGSITIEERASRILEGRLRQRPTLLINFRFPWGYMALYFEIPERLAPYLRQDISEVDDASLTVAERTLARWLIGDTDYKNERLKLIPYVAKGPWVVRHMVTGRPAIIGKKLPVTYTRDKNVLFCTLDIGSSSATAKRIVSVCRRYMSSLTVDIGFVIQAETQEELPEQMMGSVRLYHPDPLKAPRV